MERRRSTIADVVHDAERLKELQALPLERKIQISQTRIIEWYQHWNGNVAVSFSGGKDSTALLHMVRSIYPDVKAIFSNTGLEYPEIQKHVLSVENVDIIRPKMRFDEVISTYGYPLIGKEVAEAIYYARRIRKKAEKLEKEADRRRANLTNQPPQQSEREQKYWGKETFWERVELEGEYQGRRNIEVTDKTDWHNWRRRCSQKNSEQQFGIKSQFNKNRWLPLVYTPFMISHYCCFKMKKSPIKSYQHKNNIVPILGTLAEESRVRKQAWIRHGCNAFDSASPTSQPLSFWTEQDILTYIVKYDLP